MLGLCYNRGTGQVATGEWGVGMRKGNMERGFMWSLKPGPLILLMDPVGHKGKMSSERTQGERGDHPWDGRLMRWSRFGWVSSLRSRQQVGSTMQGICEGKHLREHGRSWESPGSGDRMLIRSDSSCDGEFVPFGQHLPCRCPALAATILLSASARLTTLDSTFNWDQTPLFSLD